MKTINDLVDKLNASFDYADFYIDRDDEAETYTIYMGMPDHTYNVIELIKDGRWIAEPSFGLVPVDVQKDIMDFIYTTDSNHWFDGQEKKYNIIISENPILKVAVAYFKPNNDTSLKINESATQDDLKDGSYQFTDDEIEKLKKAGNSTFNQFVDLGKVEVKDEND